VIVSIVTNAIDGLAHPWMGGTLNVLRTFARHGAPSDTVRDWGGRWCSIWSATDLVPMGAKVLVANPALLVPFADASEIAVSGPDEGVISLANGFASHGETVQRTRGNDGGVRELRLAGGTLVLEERVAAELTAREADVTRPPGRITDGNRGTAGTG